MFVNRLHFNFNSESWEVPLKPTNAKLMQKFIRKYMYGTVYVFVHIMKSKFQMNLTYLKSLISNWFGSSSYKLAEKETDERDNRYQK